MVVVVAAAAAVDGDVLDNDEVSVHDVTIQMTLLFRMIFLAVEVVVVEGEQ